MPYSKLQLSWRLASFYGAYFVVIGFFGAFWPLWLRSREVVETDIGIILATGVIAKIFVSPSVAHIADRRGDRKKIMIMLALCAAAIFSLFHFTVEFWSILLITGLFFMAWSTILPLGESLVIKNTQANSLNYGWLRLWGSVGFILATAGGGFILSNRDISIVYWLVLSSTILVLITCVLLPNTKIELSERGKAPLWIMLKDKQFMLFLAACAIIQSSHSIYYGFGSIHWKNEGYNETVIGAFWAEGVIAEIILFIYGTHLIAKIGAARLVLLGGLAAVARWTVTGYSSEIGALVVAQALHAFTFGATHLGAIYYISDVVPSNRSATALSLLGIVMSVTMAIGMATSGKLYTTFSSGAYFVMAGVGLVGVILAFVAVTNSK